MGWLKPDLIFLYIQMPGLSGFDVVSNLRQDQMSSVVFVAAFDQCAVEAFDVHVDYWFKPIDDECLAADIEHAKLYRQQEGSVTDKHRRLELMISITGRSETSVV